MHERVRSLTSYFSRASWVERRMEREYKKTHLEMGQVNPPEDITYSTEEQQKRENLCQSFTEIVSNYLDPDSNVSDSIEIGVGNYRTSAGRYPRANFIQINPFTKDTKYTHDTSDFIEVGKKDRLTTQFTLNEAKNGIVRRTGIKEQMVGAFLLSSIRPLGLEEMERLIRNLNSFISESSLAELVELNDKEAGQFKQVKDQLIQQEQERQEYWNEYSREQARRQAEALGRSKHIWVS